MWPVWVASYNSQYSRALYICWIWFSLPPVSAVRVYYFCISTPLDMDIPKSRTYCSSSPIQDPSLHLLFLTFSLTALHQSCHLPPPTRSVRCGLQQEQHLHSCVYYLAPDNCWQQQFQGKFAMKSLSSHLCMCRHVCVAEVTEVENYYFPLSLSSILSKTLWSHLLFYPAACCGS